MTDRLVVDCTTGTATSLTLTTQEQSDAAAMAAAAQTQNQQDATATTNRTTLQQKAQQALTTNATFQAIASPSNAQNAAQVQALTKQCNGIIRLLLGVLDSTGGT